VDLKISLNKQASRML